MSAALDVLRCPMQPNDAGAYLVRDYLKALLQLVWRDDECFDGKRPFGNSGWKMEVYRALCAEGLVRGTVDGDDLTGFNYEQADLLISQAIGHLL